MRPFPEPRSTPTLVVEGWRGINHSIALVNQHQLLGLLKLDGLRVFHRDMPFFLSHWSTSGNRSGLPADDVAALAAIPTPPEGLVPDCTFRIGVPVEEPDRSQGRTVTFIVTEIGLTTELFKHGVIRPERYTQGDDLVVTPSAWSRDRLIDAGFAADRVEILPHGVNTRAFHPLDPAERQARRRALGIADDEYVFLNVGLPIWNKGTDILLKAFACLRSNGRRVRLFVKDQSDVYKLTLRKVFDSARAEVPAWFGADTAAAIAVVPMTLDLDELRTLYGLADCYLSPYRAEGFNLPVLEAIACGLPAIVTRGGATDDFCTDDVALRIPGVAERPPHPEMEAALTSIKPDFDQLVAAMDLMTRERLRPTEAARLAVVSRFTWQRAALRLAELTLGHAGEAMAA